MRAALLLLVVVTALAASAAQPGRPTLRVCADPNNLPYSNARGEGFEDALAKILGEELGADVTTHWRPQRRGFLRETLKAGVCDLVLGIPKDVEMVATSKPYYRSTYVFATRADRGLAITSLDDPILRTLKIGVHVVGDDGANAPPAHALARRGIVDGVVGFTVYGDYARPNPPLDLVQAVVDGRIDVAIVWGPFAGYVARDAPTPLVLTPVSPARDGPYPFAFDVAVGARRADAELLKRVDAALAKRKQDVDALLARYGVPRA
jgi:mxaJ protein